MYVSQQELAINTEAIRKEFPVLHQKVNGYPLVYLDNAATTQKPTQVIDALVDYYQGYNANIHRGIHTLAEKATSAFEQTRESVRSLLHAKQTEEIIFVRGVTEAINLVASSYGHTFIGEGDEIMISALEHHANIVPWQWVCQQKKATLRVIPITDAGEIDVDAYKKMLSPCTKLVALAHVSNTLGTINPVKEMIRMAHQAGAVILIDGAQAAGHLAVDVQELDCDFYCLSAHKLYGPTGIGVLYGKKALLERMPPYQGGGEMIREVTYAHTTYNDLPYKFEAGTPNIADVVAFWYAIEFIQKIGTPSIVAHEQELLAYCTEKLSALPFIQLVGRAKEKVGIVSFIMDGVHCFDVGQMLDAYGIAVRTGHHCTQPLMQRLGLDGTIRASFALYNTLAEIDKLAAMLEKISKILK
ncbi:cysteine desulfurase [Rhodocytophaga rosea]|uniref:Cysteine desulfurase n=1 Tax=Rhodocytophaga rosea TaxID=2704465 RepID=A0A6C0GLJ2_9BACT|nr:cysteine desulfurase [Rhodocytophaga rosea]QHT68807.1 cysteine desulfurase [Rhodocytophaga rosea]